MTKPHDPAFPIQNAQYTEAYGGYPGMTKREHYAGLAMQGFLAAETGGRFEQIAGWSVACADALIAELNKEQKS